MSIVLLTSIILTTLVYSAFSTKLQIDVDLIVRSNNDIRVTNVSIKESTNGAYETYNNKYTKDTTSMFVTLPGNSSITYEVEITNDSDTEYKMNALEELTNSNSNITIETLLTNKTIFESNTASKYIITLSNNTSNEENISLVYKYNFVINNYYEEAEEKFTLLKNNVSGYEGVYYFDENGDLDYGDGTKISLNMTSDIPKGVVSIWNNQAIYVCLNYGKYNYEYDTTKKKLEEREMPCLTDRYQNLVINGDLSYKSNYNLTEFGTYNEEGYLYKSSSVRTVMSNNDYIPIDPNKSYKLGIDLKASNTNATYLAGIMEYDADKILISDSNILYLEGTLTELTKDLNKGDKTIYFKDLSNWNITTENLYQRGFKFWNYKDSTGYEYLPETYSQYNYYSYNYGYYENTAVDKINNTITLSNENGWTGENFKKGTYVSQMNKGYNFNYSLLNNNLSNTNWNSYNFNGITSICTADCNSYSNNKKKFRFGTKYVKLFIWLYSNIIDDTTTYSKNFFIQEIE